MLDVARPETRSAFLGQRTFGEVRRLQEDLVAARIEETIKDTVLYCEHPPTLSLGLRTQPEDVSLPSPYWRDHNIEIVRADRGGGPTYHGPGQLLIYPVVSLRGRGVKRFVLFMLSEIAEVLKTFGIHAELSCDEVGLWIIEKDVAMKLGAVGLRIVRGVTNHGFSLNVRGDLTPFSAFHPCGISGLQVTSLAALRRNDDISPSEIAARLSERLPFA